jgi:hypothetical protein
MSRSHASWSTPAPVRLEQLPAGTPAIHEPDLIRLEIASLSEEQKSVLREALAESEPVWLERA